ncbi:hypothetical protein F5Y05DRAFT_381055 [Hypoxylon sp. FL0543]|nr:hypothetical protein F5Y05DRAFT_381055 [Hypoxylon sp. FL0543]
MEGQQHQNQLPQGGLPGLIPPAPFYNPYSNNSPHPAGIPQRHSVTYSNCYFANLQNNWTSYDTAVCHCPAVNPAYAGIRQGPAMPAYLPQPVYPQQSLWDSSYARPPPNLLYPPHGPHGGAIPSPANNAIPATTGQPLSVPPPREALPQMRPNPSAALASLARETQQLENLMQELRHGINPARPPPAHPAGTPVVPAIPQPAGPQAATLAGPSQDSASTASPQPAGPQAATLAGPSQDSASAASPPEDRVRRDSIFGPHLQQDELRRLRRGGLIGWGR